MKILAELPLQESLRQSLRISEGRSIKVAGKRYSVANLRIFAVHGCKCVRCGREGNRIIAWEDRGGGLHVDLFHSNPRNPKGTLMLMNRDHIIPRSKKGGNTDWNYQPMCVRCNNKKGNNETVHDVELAKFRDHWKQIHVKLHDSFWRVVPEPLRFKWATKAFVQFRERHLYCVSYAIAKISHILA